MSAGERGLAVRIRAVQFLGYLPVHYVVCLYVVGALPFPVNDLGKAAPLPPADVEGRLAQVDLSLGAKKRGGLGAKRFYRKFPRKESFNQRDDLRHGNVVLRIDGICRGA